ncbi:MAG: hypothetical protein Q9174_003799 [Haloplaca sp. 1 TL-2023]
MAPTPRKSSKHGNLQLREASPSPAGPNKNRARYHHGSIGEQCNNSKLQTARGKANGRNQSVHNANKVKPKDTRLASCPRKFQPTSQLENNRRELCMLKAELKNSTNGDITTLEAAISVTKKKIRQKTRSAVRSQEHQIRQQVIRGSSMNSVDQLNAWIENLQKHQQVTRLAGYEWVDQGFYDRSLDMRSQDARWTGAQVLGHFSFGKGSHRTIQVTGFPRRRLSREANQVLARYDATPMKPNSEELSKAKVRMIRAMIKEGRLIDACKRGFKYSNREYTEARIGLIVGKSMADCKLRPVPKIAKFYKEKNIAWRHVQQWTGVQLHQLPLQGYEPASARVQGGEDSGKAINGDEDGGDMEGVDGDEDEEMDGLVPVIRPDDMTF